MYWRPQDFPADGENAFLGSLNDHLIRIILRYYSSRSVYNVLVRVDKYGSQRNSFFPPEEEESAQIQPIREFCTHENA